MVLLAQYIRAHSTSTRDPRLNWRTAIWLVVHFQQRLLKVKVKKHPVAIGLLHSIRGMVLLPTLKLTVRSVSSGLSYFLKITFGFNLVQLISNLRSKDFQIHLFKPNLVLQPANSNVLKIPNNSELSSLGVGFLVWWTYIVDKKCIIQHGELVAGYMQLADLLDSIKSTIELIKIR